MIKIEHLKKEYMNVTPLIDVNVEINDRDVISVIGPSGTGKSTLLRCINMLEEPTAGHIYIDGEDITDPSCDIYRIRLKMGMVFQNFNLFGHMTVMENLMVPPMDLLGKSRQEAYDKAIELLRMVGLSDKMLNFPDELSGGQKQRIAIARTLAMDPDIILLDEPTSALDPTMVEEVQAVIRNLAGTGKTMMIVTHEMAFARAISNRVFYMDEGGIYEDGSPEQIFDHPKRENTRRFIRRLKVLELMIGSRHYDFPGITGQISQYCSKNQIPLRLTRNIHLVFEELVHQILVPALKEPAIEIIVEYSSETETALMTVSYNGPTGTPLDIRQTGDELSLALIKGITVRMDYEETGLEDYPNRISLEIAG